MATANPPAVFYPESDGKPMAENTRQYEAIVVLHDNLDRLLPDFVGADNFWYPVEGKPEVTTAPDVYVALGRPKGHRGSYKQWEEGGVAPQVVFEVISPGNSGRELRKKFQLYQAHGVREYVEIDPDPESSRLSVWVRDGDQLVPVDAADGWMSPLLGIRLVPCETGADVFHPDGSPFLTFAQQADGRATAERKLATETRKAARHARRADRAENLLEAEREKAARLAAKLRALGLDPDAP